MIPFNPSEPRIVTAIRAAYAAGWIGYATPNLYVWRHVPTGKILTRPRPRARERHPILHKITRIGMGLATGYGLGLGLGAVLPWYGQLGAGVVLGYVPTSFPLRLGVGLAAPLVGIGESLVPRKGDAPLRPLAAAALYYGGRALLRWNASAAVGFGSGIYVAPFFGGYFGD